MIRPRPSILVVEDDPHLADQLRWALKDDYRIHLIGDRAGAVVYLKNHRPDLMLVDLCLPPDDVSEEGFRILRAARAADPEVPVVVMSAIGEREAALRAVAEGAYDFFSKPVDLDALRVVLTRSLERRALERENRRLRAELRERFGVDGILGASPAMGKVLQAIHRAKDAPITVLIEGESGTGKELVARALHFSGNRAGAPFVAVNCAALPETLLESELFGHEKGAFTGADAPRVGRFEAAEGGTLFLDEIASMSPSTQAKLLRVLQERTIERLGSNRTRRVDIRLVAATNEDLGAMVARGAFREDLFYRVHVFRIALPPLRERGEDIPLLAEHFLRASCEGRGEPAKRFAPDAHEALAARAWPGNVRELANLVETLSLVVDGPEIRARDLPPARAAFPGLPGLDRARAVGLKAVVDEYEKRILTDAIARSNGIKARAAEDLGLDPSQMKYLVKKHGL